MKSGAITPKGSSSGVSRWADKFAVGGGWSHWHNSPQVKTTRPVLMAESSLATGKETDAPPNWCCSISCRTGAGQACMRAEIFTPRDSCSAAGDAGAGAGMAGVFGWAKGITAGDGVFGADEGWAAAPGGLAKDGSRGADAGGFGKLVGSDCVVGCLAKGEAPGKGAAGFGACKGAGADAAGCGAAKTTGASGAMGAAGG
jgi:hypothetical protein